MPQRQVQIDDSSVTFVWDATGKVIRVDGDIVNRTVTVELLNEDNTVRGSYQLNAGAHQRAIPAIERVDVIEESVDAGNGTPRPVTRFRHRTQW